jgi:hypothetical protein
VSAAILGASNPAFTPASISSATKLGWWKADAGLFQNTALTIPAVADGDPVGGWADQFGSNALIQATAGKRGALKLNIQNGLPVVRFNPASSQQISVNLLSQGTQAQPYSYFFAFRMRSTGNIVNIFLCNSDASNPYFSVTSAPAWDVFCGTADRSFGTSDTNFHIMSFEMNGALSKWRVDGVPEAQISATPGANSIDGINLASIGGGTPTNFSDCDFGEVILLGGTASVADKAALFSYLNKRWGVF